MTQKVQFKSVTVDSISRTAITAPTACSEVELLNEDLANDCQMYDAATSGNSKALRAGQSVRFGGGSWRTAAGFGTGYRWASGDTICWVQADAGTGPIRVTVVV